eukprot:gene594-2016_t
MRNETFVMAGSARNQKGHLHEEPMGYFHRRMSKHIRPAHAAHLLDPANFCVTSPIPNCLLCATDDHEMGMAVE